MNSPYWNFKLDTNLVFGARSVERIPEFMKEKGYKSVAIIVDKGVDSSDYWQQFVKHLKNQAHVSLYFVNEKMEPTYDYLDGGATKVWHQLSGISSGACNH